LSGICSTAAKAWLRLALVKGIGPVLGRRLVDACGGIGAIWPLDPESLKRVEGVGNRLIEALAASRPEAAENIARLCREHEISLISSEDSDWPAGLIGTDDAPMVLFVAGDPARLNSKRMLAVVGARRASREGRLLARRWSRYCCEHGVTIVSGMAYGIDAEAHGGALEGGGPTVAVLGCGLQRLNEQQSRQVAAICANGCVVSEFLPETDARPENFPRRNRIIAALSAATVVVEADVGSGSLITARNAAAYGREVFAVPGSVLGGNHSGCHALIRDGAILADSAESMLSELGWQRGVAAPGSSASGYVPATAEEAEVLAALGRECMHVDEICQTCGLTLSKLSPILLALELQGVIERLPGSRYLLSVE